jgi:hypothetical protein
VFSLSWKRAFVRAWDGEIRDATLTFRFQNGREIPQEAALRDLFDAAFGVRRPEKASGSDPECFGSADLPRSPEEAAARLGSHAKDCQCGLCVHAHNI